MKIDRLRQAAGSEVVDYPFVISALQHYKSPRNRISRWLKEGVLIRVKKGLYVFGPSVARQPIAMEVLANLVYGPSYLSLEWALSYYGLISERVHEMTSVTCRRDKRFETPVGVFSYRYLRTERYSVGFVQQALSSTEHFMIASPEKALADYLMLRIKAAVIDSDERLQTLLFDNLRIDEDALASLDPQRLSQLNKRLRHDGVSRLAGFLKERTS